MVVVSFVMVALFAGDRVGARAISYPRRESRLLTRIGRTDVAYRLLTQDTYPSWGYEIKNGATTIWERWDGVRPDDHIAAKSRSCVCVSSGLSALTQAPWNPRVRFRIAICPAW